MKMYDADSLVAKLEAAQNDLLMRGQIAAERNVAKFALQVVYDEPTVDAEPVVRCKECKHRMTYECPMCHEEDYYDDDDGWGYVIRNRTEDDGFCHKGAKMDGGENHAAD